MFFSVGLTHPDNIYQQLSCGPTFSTRGCTLARRLHVRTTSTCARSHPRKLPKRGKRCLRGYLYTKHCTNDHLVIWRCKRRICRGRIAATPAGLVTEVPSLHYHEASQARVGLAQVRKRMKELAQSSVFATAGQIFHASIGSCSNEVLAIRQKESVIERTINYHKALPPIGVRESTGHIQYSRTLGANPQLFLR